MRIIAIVILLITPYTIQAQVLNTRLTDQWQLSFLKQDITWDWQGKLLYHKEKEMGWGVHLADNFTSNLLASNQTSDRWRDERQNERREFVQPVRPPIDGKDRRQQNGRQQHERKARPAALEAERALAFLP